MGFWGLPLNRYTPTQLPMGQLRRKTEHLLKVGAPARPAPQLAKPSFCLRETSTLPVAVAMPRRHSRGASWCSWTLWRKG